jgi:hypothetical protein
VLYFIASQSSAYKLLDIRFHLRRICFRIIIFYNIALVVEQKLSKVPRNWLEVSVKETKREVKLTNLKSKPIIFDYLKFLGCCIKELRVISQKLKNWISIWSIDFSLSQYRKIDSELSRYVLFNLSMLPGFLLSELVAREGKDF